MRLKPAAAMLAIPVMLLLLSIPYAASPGLSTFLLSHNVLEYNSNRYLVPSVQIGYSTVNISNIYINATLYAIPPRTRVYMLDTSGSCFNCGQLTQIVSQIDADLQQYSVIQNASQVGVVGQQNITSLPGGSILIILNGVLPSYMLSQGPDGNPIMQDLLAKGVDIIYVGRNFGNVSNGQILLPTQQPLPYFMAWGPHNPSLSYPNNPFYFHLSTFLLAGTTAKQYGPLSYLQVINGSLIIFSNYLNTWPNSSDAARDIAKTTALQFWIPRYATTSSVITPPSSASSTGQVNLPLLNLNRNFTYSTAIGTPIAYGRVVIYSTGNFSLSNSSIYRFISYTQNFTQNGSILLPGVVGPGVQLPTSITINTGSGTPVTISPHVTIYSINYTPVQSIPLHPFTASGNFTQIQALSFYLPPGQYLARVEGFYGKQYAVALFNVSQIKVNLTSENYTTNTYLFSITSGGLPVSNVNYTINVNGVFQASGTVYNGTIAYKLPQGSPVQKGATFYITMLSTTYTATTPTSNITIHISNDYIAIAIVGILSLVIITVVKAPNRDEFYIDVPTVREQNPTPIKIIASELVAVFDKQNVYYRWKYMPLNVEEARQAIANNIKASGMAVSLTYSNVELLLAQLSTAGFLVSADSLYAPKAWVTKSGHDIEYLATFKKLRLFFVSHAYQFNDIDGSDKADIVATIHGERVYIVIYSRTSKFQKMPIFADSRTYLAFLNADKRDEFLMYLRNSTGPSTEEIKMYTSAGQLTLIDADNPGEALT